MANTPQKPDIQPDIRPDFVSPNATAGQLSNAEAVQGGASSAATASDDIGQSEASAANPATATPFQNNTSPRGSGVPKTGLRGFLQSGGGAFFKKATAPAIALFAVLAVGVVVMLLVGASQILVTVAQKAVEQTMNAAPAITMLRGMQLSQQRLANLKGDTLKGICGNVVSIRCKLGTFGKEDILAMEREGIKVTPKKGGFWDTLNGRSGIESVEINGRTMTADEFANAIKSGDKVVTSRLTSALEPKWKSFAKNSFYKVLARIGGTKGVNIKSAQDRVQLEQELIDRVSGKTLGIEEAGLEQMRDEKGNVKEYRDPATGKVYTPGTTEFDDFVASKSNSYAKIKSVQDRLKLTGDKISEFAAKNSVKALAVGVGVMQIGCAGWNVIRTAETATTQYGMANMANYANIFLNQASMIRAGKGQADVASYLGDILTSTNSAGKSGMDSRAAKQLFYGDQSPLPQTTYADPANPTAEEQEQAVLNNEVTAYTAGSSVGPEALKQIANAASIKADSPAAIRAADNTCGVINSPVVGNIMLGVGLAVSAACFASAIIPGLGEATVGGCVTDLAIQGGTLLAIMGVLTGLQKLLSTISGTMITGKENGPEAMQAFTTGTEVLGYYNGLNSGLTVGTDEDATNFETAVLSPAKSIYAEIDRQEHPWYDTSNSNTFLGSITSTLYPQFATLASSSNASQILSTLGSIITSPLSLFAPKASAGATASSACASTIFSGYALSQNCTPLATTSQEVLNISTDDATTYLLNNNEIDESGAPIGPHFTEYLKYCTSEREYALGMAPDGEANDVTRGDICGTTYSGANAETYRNIQAYMQIVSATSDVDIFPDSTSSQLGSTGTCPTGSTVIPSITEGWDDGKKTAITLCAITGTEREKPIVETEFKRKVYNGLAANGVNEIALTSDAATSYIAMLAKAKESGVSLNATFSYRSYNEQKAIRGTCSNSGSCTSSDQKKLNDDGSLSGNTLPGNYDNNRAAAGYSNHQTGLSLDISSGKDWIDKCVSVASYDGADDGRCFGFYFDVSGDPMHLTFKPK